MTKAASSDPSRAPGRRAREAWPSLNYREWSATCDTLHAHTQVLGKLAVALAPPEPQLQHAALRLAARGWETLPLPAPDQSGALVAGLDLRAHEAFLEHSDGRTHRVAPSRTARLARSRARYWGRCGSAGRPSGDRPDAPGGGVERAP